jgi:hypothetical protein
MGDGGLGLETEAGTSSGGVSRDCWGLAEETADSPITRKTTTRLMPFLLLRCQR